MYNTKKKDGGPMMFYDKEHMDRYFDVLSKMCNNNEKHASFAYLATSVKAPIHECFDFEKDEIKADMLECDWIRSESSSVLKLAKNLWDDTNPANVSEVFASVSRKYSEIMFYAVQMRYGYISYLYCVGKDA